MMVRFWSLRFYKVGRFVSTLPNAGYVLVMISGSLGKW